MKNSKNTSAAGFSVAELLTVVSVIIILSTFAIMSMSATKLYNSDKQALQITDLMQEARQRSLSQRNTVRVEINRTRQQIRIIDERTSGNPADDVLVKEIPFMGDGVYVATAPSNMTANPTESSPVPAVAFSTSSHPLSSGDTVAVRRFMKNGNVTDGGTNAAATDAVPTGATIYVWSKYLDDTSPTPTVGQIFRAITVQASSGSTRLWKCNVSGGNCSEWTK